MKRKATFSLVALWLSFAIFSSQQAVAQGNIIMQGFYWNTIPGDLTDVNNGGVWWDTIALVAPQLKNAGFNVMWTPPAQKGFAGKYDMGYGVSDYYDYGQFNQFGTIRTRHGNLAQLQNAINTLKNNNIKVMADLVLNHRAGASSQQLEDCDIPNDARGKELHYTNFTPASGRIAMDSSHFHPTQIHCDLNAEYHNRSFFEDICYFNHLNNVLNPSLANNGWYFGPHNLGAAGDSLIIVGRHMIDTMGFDMVRLDAVKHIEPGFLAPFLVELKNGTQPFAVGELFDGNVNTLRNYQVEVENFISSYGTGSKNANMGVFDFALRYALRDMCNAGGSYDMANLNNSGLIFNNTPLAGEDVVTFVENHDVDRIGFSDVPCPGGVLQIGNTCLGFTTDSGHDPIVSNKYMAYAYILGAEGHPSIFWKDYFWYGLDDEIKWLIALRKQFAKGGSTPMSLLNPLGGSFTTADYFIMRRAGLSNGVSDGAMIGLNDNAFITQETFVTTAFSNKYLKDYSDGFMFVTKEAFGDGRASIPTAKLDYSWWAPTGLYPKPDGVAASHFTMNATPGGCPHYITLQVNDAANYLVNGSPIQIGDEIAIKNAAGQVVGIGRIGQGFKWNGIHDMVIEVLGSPSSNGMANGETFRLFVYDASTNTEEEAAVLQFALNATTFSFSPDRPNTPNRNGNFSTFSLTASAMGTYDCGKISRITAFNTQNVQTQTICGTDNAGNNPYNDNNNWQNGYNGGTNFGAWTLSPGSNNSFAGFFRGSSTVNGDGDFNGDGDINTSGNALALYANTNNTASALRNFVTPLIPGTVFSLKMDNGWIESNAGQNGAVGFGLQNASGNNLLEFYFVAGQSKYQFSDAMGAQNTTLDFTDEGLTVQFTLITATTYQLIITRIIDNATFITSGTLSNPAGGQNISRFRLFNYNPSASGGDPRNAYFNNFSICYPATLVINEVDYDQDGTDTAEFIELKNVSTDVINLDNYIIELVNGVGNAVYQTIDLPNVNLATGDYYVICANAANTPNCDLDVSDNTNWIQNGDPDAIRLKLGTLTIDALSYGGNVTGAVEGSGTGLTDNPGAGSVGLSRILDGNDTNQNNVDFKLVCITPGTANYLSDYGDLGTKWKNPCAAVFTDANNDGIPDGSNGAVWAGATVDTETSQQYSVNANGDDNNGLDDENGLSLPVALVRGQSAQFSITLNSNLIGTNMYYGLWFDWDLDAGGVFESFYNNVVPLVYNGSPVTALVAVTPPLNALDDYKVRLIVSGNGPITSTQSIAPFSNGEIEDYDKPIILPIELLDFTANVTNDAQVQLKWTTASEKNNAYFSVQRSREGQRWTEIGQVKGQGNSVQVQSYDYLDKAPFAGTNYYRLQQFDWDGQSSISPVRVIEVQPKRLTARLYPNPAKEWINLQLEGVDNQRYKLKIYNVLGQEIFFTSDIIQTGEEYNISTAALNIGTYFLRISNENGQVLEIISFQKQ